MNSASLYPPVLSAKVGIVSLPLTNVKSVSLADILSVKPVGLLVDTVTGKLAVPKAEVNGFKLSETVSEGMVTRRLGVMLTFAFMLPSVPYVVPTIASAQNKLITLSIVIIDTFLDILMYDASSFT